MFDIKKITSIRSEKEFSDVALEIFRFQAESCAPYKNYIELLEVNPDKITDIRDIPFLPIEFFKTQKVYCGSNEPDIIFTSSSTSSDTPSKHYVAHLDYYKECFFKAFNTFYEPTPIYALLPCYMEREGSSLIYMVDALIKHYGGGFYLNDYEQLLKDLEANQDRNKILLGVSYALWDLAEQFSPKLKNTIVMETGGMKGHREEISKTSFHKILCNAFGIEKIHSEYGMAELMSQAYSYGHGIFSSPPWMKITIRDINNPFDRMSVGRSGGVNITDLGNVYSCAFIETQDLGRMHETGEFELLGRIDNSQIRGCNLLIQ